MAHLYLCEELDASELTPGAIVEIVGDEARHATRVSRLRLGERTMIGDGQGTAAEGPVVQSDKGRMTIQVDTVYREAHPTVTLTLVQALAKGDRAERAVEQATEFGVDRIIPWEAARSVSRWNGSGRGDKATRGVAKWQRVAREAAKQSMRLWVPVIQEPLTTQELSELAAPDTQILVLHPDGDDSLREWASTALPPAITEVLVVIGPEGGLSAEELETLGSAGAQILRLGSPVLRTSSAGPAALAVLNVALERW